MTAGEIAALAKGFSPLFFLKGLVMYRPFIRSDLDVAKNFAMIETGSPGVADHLKMIYPDKYNLAPFAAAASTVRTLAALGVG